MACVRKNFKFWKYFSPQFQKPVQTKLSVCKIINWNYCLNIIILKATKIVIVCF